MIIAVEPNKTYAVYDIVSVYFRSSLDPNANADEQNGKIKDGINQPMYTFITIIRILPERERPFSFIFACHSFSRFFIVWRRAYTLK